VSRSLAERRKDRLVTLGLWGLVTGRGRLAKAVEAALQRESLRHG